MISNNRVIRLLKRSNGITSVPFSGSRLKKFCVITTTFKPADSISFFSNIPVGISEGPANGFSRYDGSYFQES
jgi:hypothetical protein